MVNSTSLALAKLKGASGGLGKTPQAEKKETPQERLKRIMSKQLNKQSMSLLLLFLFLSALVILGNPDHLSSYAIYTKFLFALQFKKTLLLRPQRNENRNGKGRKNLQK